MNIVNSIKLTLLILLIISCTTIDANKTNIVFTEVYDRFLNELNIRGLPIPEKNLKIDFGNTKTYKKTAVGTCYYGIFQNSIAIDRMYWDNASEIEKEMVLFHELGHCLLGLGHTDPNEQIGIMNPILIDKYFYDQYRELLLNDMFNIYKESI